MNYSTSKKEVVVFKANVPAGQTVTLKERVKAPGTIEEVRVRFYPGQEMALQVTPIVEHKGRIIESLVTYAEGGERYLSGEDDVLILPTIITVDYDDEVKIIAKNTDSAFAYTMDVTIVIDYYAGSDRIIGGAVRG